MKRKNLDLFSAMLCCFLLLSSCSTQADANDVNIKEEVYPYLSDIKVDYYTAKDSKWENSVSVIGFDPAKEEFKVEGKAVAPCIGLDFTVKSQKIGSIKVENESIAKSVINAVTTDKTKYNVERVYLTHGINKIKITVSSERGTKQKTYTVLVEYDKPKPKLDPIFKSTGENLDGFLCPAPGKNEFVWVIYGAGDWAYCGKSLSAAQTLSEDKKFKDAGLRVVAITSGGIHDGQWLTKLALSGVKYNSYAEENNIFKGTWEKVKAVPQNVFYKNGKFIKMDVGGKDYEYYKKLLRDLFDIK